MSDLIIDPSKIRNLHFKTNTPSSTIVFELPQHPQKEDLESATPSLVGKNGVTGKPLTNARISHADLTALIKEIQSGTLNDSALFLAGNNIHDTTMTQLSNALKFNQTLKHIILSRNNITPFAAAGLADLLKVNHQIGWLVLSKNKLADAGISTIGQGLKYNKTLKHLIVDNNNIGDKGALSLATNITGHPNLLTLDLSHNNITLKGAMALLKSSKSLPNLRKIDLSNNALSDSDKKILSNQFKKLEVIL